LAPKSTITSPATRETSPSLTEDAALRLVVMGAGAWPMAFDSVRRAPSSWSAALWVLHEALTKNLLAKCLGMVAHVLENPSWEYELSFMGLARPFKNLAEGDRQAPNRKSSRTPGIWEVI
jgi:hypothetical protein